MEDKRRVFDTFVYPMIALCGLAVLLSSLLSFGVFDGPEYLQQAMIDCSAVAVSLFAGFFLSAALIGVLYAKLTDSEESDKSLIQQFTGYSMVVPFSLKIIVALLPSFTLLSYLAQFYVAYVIWEGTQRLLPRVGQNQLLTFTIISSAILLICPMLIEKVFTMLTTMLN